MKKKPQDILQEKIDHLDNFLKEAKKINEVIPTVKEAREIADWAKEVFQTMPPEASKQIDEPKIGYVLNEDLKVWKNILPNFQINPQRINSMGSGASGTASEVVFTQLNSFTNPSLLVNQWVNPHINNFIKIQERKDKVNSINTVLQKVRQSCATEFMEAHSAYQKADKEFVDAKSASISMRNVIEHVKGEMVELARNASNRQAKKSEHWLFISKELTTGGIGSSEYNLLLQQGVIYEEIHQELTAISKNLAINPLQKLRVVHIKWLDHLDNSLKLIDPKFL